MRNLNFGYKVVGVNSFSPKGVETVQVFDYRSRFEVVFLNRKNYLSNSDLLPARIFNPSYLYLLVSRFQQCFLVNLVRYSYDQENTEKKKNW